MSTWKLKHVEEVPEKKQKSEVPLQFLEEKVFRTILLKNTGFVNVSFSISGGGSRQFIWVLGYPLWAKEPSK